ncbi:MAG: site-specific integrase [Deltaproteobacteria bacterium]|nr:site-specific integrase [Deltaproteobacteria bacterium]
MATIRKRDNADGTSGFHVQIRLAGFPPVTKSFSRKTDAKLWAQKTEATMREGRYFPEREAERRTLAMLVDRYVAEVCPNKKDGTKQARQLEWWKSKLGFRPLVDCTPEVIATTREALASELVNGKRRSGATINRYLAALSHAFTMARKEWRWIRENPLLSVTRKKESQGRVRMLDALEEGRLLRACGDGPAYLRPVVVLALRTGMRQGEVLGLRWGDVDLKGKRIVLHDTKNGERRGVPLDTEAVKVLRGLEKTRDLDDETVFVGTASFRWAFGRAVKRATLQNFRFHDLRHTAASHLAMSGCSPSEIATVLGHKTLAMVKRYAHLADAHLDGVMARRAKHFPLQSDG